MSSGSFTILPYINPPAGYADVTAAIVSIAGVDNNFTVPQRMAGVVNSGGLTVEGASRFTGVCTFDSIPQFDAGIEVDISTLSTGSLNVAGASTLSGGLSVTGVVSLPSASLPASTLTKSITDAQIVAAGVSQASLLNGYVDLVGAQSVAGVKTFASAPVMSGSSISAASIPAASIVADSISDAQIAPAGIGQSSIASGYVDLASAQSVNGAKIFNGIASFPAGLSALSSTSVQNLSATNVTASTVTVAGPMSATGANGSFSASQLITGSKGITISGGPGTFNSGVATTTLSASGVASIDGNTTVGGALFANSNLSVSGTATINGVGGLSVINGSSSLQAVSCTALTATSGITGNLTGDVTGVSSRVRITSDNSDGSYLIPFTKTAGSNTLFCDDTAAPLITYNPSAGLLTAVGFTATGVATLSGGMVLPVIKNTLALVAGVITINMNNLSYAEYILPAAALTGNITSFVFQNVIVNGKFNIYIQGGVSNRNINKNLSSGVISQVNTLGGNTQIAANSVWRIEGDILSSTLVALQMINYT